MNNVKVDFKCKMDRESEEQDYTVELDLSNITQEDWDEFALRSIIIACQSAIRAYNKLEDKGNKTNPIANGVYKVNKPGTRSVANPDKVKEQTMKLLKKLTPEQLADFLAALG
jgi:hypothetical protein